MVDTDEVLRDLLKDTADLSAESPVVAKFALLIARSHLVEIASATGDPGREFANAIACVEAAIAIVSAAIDKALAAKYGTR